MCPRKKLIKCKGLTLIELLISTTLAIIFFSMALTVYHAAKTKYKSYKNKISIEVKELNIKRTLHDFIKNTGFACKFGYSSQVYYNRINGSLDNFFLGNLGLSVGPLPLPVNTNIQPSLGSSCTRNCYQPGTNYIMVQKEDSHTKLKNTNVELYQADPYLLSNNLTYQFFNNDIVESTKDLIFNSLASHAMTQYSGDNHPLNVPYVDPDGMSDYLAAYKLDSDGRVASNKRGYVGYVQKNDNILIINLSSNSLGIKVPNDLSINDYRFNIGWDLKSGSWNIFLAVYDSKKLYTSSTSLLDLIDNQLQAQIDLGDWKEVEIPKNDNILKEELILVKWFQDSSNNIPKPLILRKVEGANKNIYYYIYSSIYNAATKVFTTKLPVTFKLIKNLLSSNVAVALPDNLFTLDVVSPLIQINKALMLYDPANNRLKNIKNLDVSALDTPVVVRKNSTDLYYIIFNGSNYYQYNYTGGAINGTRCVNYHDEAISKIVAKFESLFIFTNKYLRINDFNSNTLNKIPIDSTKKYQILRDNNGKIYIMPDAMTCKINNSCNKNNRIYINTDCSTYCDKIKFLNNIASSLGLVYRKSV